MTQLVATGGDRTETFADSGGVTRVRWVNERVPPQPTRHTERGGLCRRRGGLASQSATVQSEAVGSAIYIESYDNSMYALDAGTGQLECVHPAPSSVRSSSAMVTIYTGPHGETPYVINNARYTHGN